MASACDFDRMADGLLAYHPSTSGLMDRSLPATSIQLGLVRQAAVVIVAAKLSFDPNRLQAAPV